VNSFHRMFYVFAARTGAPAGISTSIKVFRIEMPRLNDFYPAEEPDENDPEPEEEYANTLCALSGLRTTVRCAEMGGLPYASTPYQQKHWKMTKTGRKAAKQAGEEFPWSKPSAQSLFEEGQLFKEHAIEDGDEPDDKDMSEDERMKLDAMLKTCKERETEEGEYKKEEFTGWRETFQNEKNDPVNNKFRTMVARAPQQCLRYCQGGEPLWASTDNQPQEGEIPPSEDGTPRHFEFQILPQMLYHLEIEKAAGVTNFLEAKQQSTLDFGTISVYASVGGPVGEYIEEVAWLQPY